MLLLVTIFRLRHSTEVNPHCISRRTAKILAMIPALLLILVCGRLSHRDRAFRSSPARPGCRISRRLLRLRFARQHIFPAKYKFTVPLIALLISDVVLNIHYGAPLFTPIDRLPLPRVRAGRLCLGLLLQNRASLKTLLPASLAGSTHLLHYHQSSSWLIDPGLREKFRRSDSSADCRLAAIQRHADAGCFFVTLS